jgi:diguanylate cyclase (GGDEF)-like protein/PAS domain S-box-containing protein
MSALAEILGWVENAPTSGLAAALVLAGLVAGGALLRHATLAPPECRRAWLWIGIACFGWNVGHAAALLGLPLWLFWWVLRPLELMALAVGINLLPGAARSLRDWLIATSDGWMKVGGVAVIAWLVLHDSGVDLARLLGAPSVGIKGPALTWSALDFLIMSVLGGLLAQAPDRDRRTVTYVLFAGLVAALGDLTWGITGYPRVAMISWAVTTLLISATPRVGGRDVFRTTFIEGGRVRVIRAGQLPLIPAAVFLFAPIDHDWTVTLMVAAVVVVVFASVVHHSVASAALLDTVSQQRGQFEALLTDSRDALLQVDESGVIEFVNDAAAHVLGWPIEQLMRGRSVKLLHPDDVERVIREQRALRDPGIDAIRIEYRNRAQDGVYRHVESTISRRQDAPGFVVSTRDVTARVKLRDELAVQARTDPLTGLLNRSAFLAVVGERATRPEPVIVLFVDLDEFKAVNDSLGHAAGDRLLQDVATRIGAVVGPDDAVARLGGDEFAVVVDAGVPPADLAPGVAAFQHGQTVAQRILDAVGEIRPPGHPGMRQHVSVGVAAGVGQSAEEMLRDADLAMYRAKATGGASAVRFEPWMRDRVQERARLRERLEVAIEHEGLSLALQPVVDLPGRRSGPAAWHGFEALVRWQDGDVWRLPDEFIPLAEESGLIAGLGTWVMRTAVHELARWPGGEELTMAVNVSPLQMEKDGFADDVLRLLETEGVAPRRLVLEITEQTAVQDLGRTASRLGPLRDRGVHVAIDDFGTGYSSMRYLTRLPVDALKIDRQFVDGLGARRDDEVLVTTMLRLAADLGLDVVAEGVETELQAEILRGHGCHLAQGFLFARPQPVPDLRRLWLESLGLPALTT